MEEETSISDSEEPEMLVFLMILDNHDYVKNG
jgi:hypothetical protein